MKKLIKKQCKYFDVVIPIALVYSKHQRCLSKRCQLNIKFLKEIFDDFTKLFHINHQRKNYNMNFYCK